MLLLLGQNVYYVVDFIDLPFLFVLIANFATGQLECKSTSRQ